MKREGFLKLLARHFYPVLRTEGFRGSGTTLRRVRPPAVHVFHFQGSSGGTSGYLNLGCHFDFLPMMTVPVTPTTDLSAVLDSACALQGRIHPPPFVREDWEYGTSESEAVATVNSMIAEWPRQAHPFFEQHAYPDGLARLVAENPPADLYEARILVLAQVAAGIGQRQRAAELANMALAKAMPATPLTRRIEALLQQLKSN